jgi:hypothetical protein
MGIGFALIWRRPVDFNVQENSPDGRRPFRQPRDVLTGVVLKRADPYAGLLEVRT